MAVVLGLLVAAFYGSGDFFGGLASKRTPTTAVVIGSITTSIVGLTTIALVSTAVGTLPDVVGRNVVLGAGAGVVGPMALGLLYRSLSRGPMSVVAPITAVVAATVPFIWGLLQGERPAAVALVGIAVALVAVVLISSSPVGEPANAEPSRRPKADGALIAASMGAGAGFGMIYILLGSVNDDSGLWPLLSARTVAFVVAVGAVLVRSRLTSGAARPVRPALWAPAGVWRLIAITGVLDITANGLYLAAAQRGLISIVAVLSSLYPASTVLLARVVLHERLHRVQVGGLVLAAAGVVAMAAG